MQQCISLLSLLSCWIARLIGAQPFKNSIAQPLRFMYSSYIKLHTIFQFFFFFGFPYTLLPFCSMLKPMSILLLQSLQLFFFLSFLSNNSFTCRKYVYTIDDILILCTIHATISTSDATQDLIRKNNATQAPRCSTRSISISRLPR